MRHASAAVIIALLSPISALAQPTALVGARIIPIAGPSIDNAVLIVDNKKITALGPAASVTIPVGAIRVDCTGKTIMPGLVDTHSHVGGIGGADGSAPIQPDVRIYDSLNIRDSGFRRAVAGGITTINIMAGSGHLLSGQTV